MNRRGVGRKVSGLRSLGGLVFTYCSEAKGFGSFGSLEFRGLRLFRVLGA